MVAAIVKGGARSHELMLERAIFPTHKISAGVGSPQVSESASINSTRAPTGSGLLVSINMPVRLALTLAA